MRSVASLLLLAVVLLGASLVDSAPAKAQVIVASPPYAGTPYYTYYPPVRARRYARGYYYRPAYVYPYARTYGGWTSGYPVFANPAAFGFGPYAY